MCYKILDNKTHYIILNCKNVNWNNLNVKVCIKSDGNIYSSCAKFFCSTLNIFSFLVSQQKCALPLRPEPLLIELELKNRGIQCFALAKAFLRVHHLLAPDRVNPAGLEHHPKHFWIICLATSSFTLPISSGPGADFAWVSVVTKIHTVFPYSI